MKYQPNIELNFFKKYFGNNNRGKPITQENIIPKYSNKLKIIDLIKITLN